MIFQTVPRVPQEYTDFINGPYVEQLLRTIEIRLGFDVMDISFGELLLNPYWQPLTI